MGTVGGTATPGRRTTPICPVPGLQRLVEIAIGIRPLGGAPPCPGPGTAVSGALAETSSFAPTALFGLEAINRGGSWAFGQLSILGTECPCLGSAWEPSNSLVLYSDHLIE